MQLKFWVDPIESSPIGYMRANSIAQAKLLIAFAVMNCDVEEININQNVNDYGLNNANIFDLLEWLIESNIQTNIILHGQDNERTTDIIKFMNGSCLCLI